MATENPRVWFKSISLENVRSFGTKQTINFTDKDGNAARWNVILGDNGSGKTTVLKSLALIQSDFDDKIILYRSIYYPSLIRSGYKSLSIEINYESPDNVTHDYGIVISDHERLFHRRAIEKYNYGAVPMKEVKLFGYGAARRIGESSITEDQNKYSANTLFNEKTDLINAEEWLIQADYLRLRDKAYEKNFSVVHKVIKTLFREEGSGIMFDTSSGVPKVRLATQYGLIHIHELSLGYKTLIAWMVDFAKGLLDRYPDSPNPLAEPAVCLVDELDLHLHPKFQRNIIQFLTETFPNTQFIVTAHSPLIVQSAEDANIILLKREGNETHVAEGIDVHSWRIDQILSSDLFGGISSRAPQVEEKMSRRRSLLRKDKRSSDEQHELDDLEKELGELPVMETREALKAIDIISKAVIIEGQP